MRPDTSSKPELESTDINDNGSSIILRLSSIVLIVAISALAYQFYHSLIVPYMAYGEADMSYLDNENPRSLSAGDLTHFHSGRKAFEQEAPNLPWGLAAAFDRGDGIFERPFTPSVTSNWRYDADGLGPLFNESSCVGCHIDDGRPPAPTGPDSTILGGFVRVSIPGIGPYGEPLSPLGYGAQISDKAIDGVKPEAKVRVKWVEEESQFPDGENYSLRRPEFIITELAYGPLPDDAEYELRLAPPVHGLGLLEAIPEETILGWADPDDADGDGISGRPNYVWDIERGGKVLGRFSWKANAFDIRQQSAMAAYNDIGINNPLFLYRHDDQQVNHKSRQNCEPEQIACLQAFDSKEFEMTPDQLLDVTTYLQLLGVVYRRNMDDPVVQRGESLFHKANCVSCHKSEVTTGEHELARLEHQFIRPYSDLLLHDMGKGLAGRRDFEATEQEWRTAPLWGIGVTETVNGHTNFLHDGRARNIEEAILWHGGEAKASKEFYMQLSKAEREAVLEFLNSL
jgi:CxxC motif-containing protein (DUF1111 family)